MTEDNFKKQVDEWVKELKREIVDVNKLSETVDENVSTIQSNYEMIVGLKDKLEHMDGELKALKLLQLLSLKRNLKKNSIEEVSLPISIFNKKIGMLEAACLYLKDKLKLSFNEIADLLKRDYKTIHSSYQKAKKKGG